MKKEFVDFVKSKKVSKSKDNKSFNIIKNNIMKKIKTSTTNNPSKFFQKKISEKNQSFFTEKKYINSRPQINQENENDYNLKLDTKVLSSVFKYNFENSLEPPKLKNETVLNFQKFSKFSFNPFEADTPNDFKKNEIYSPLFQYGAKYIINDIHKSIYNNIDSVVKLQSNLRGYLVKKKLRINSLNKIYFEKKSIKSIIFIQKYIRGFLSRINIRKKIIIKFIYQKRKTAAELIIKKMQSYVNVIKMKKLLFINYHLEQRKQKAIFIQETFRNYKFYKSFKKLKKEIDANYYLDYPYQAQKVEIILCFDDEIYKKKDSKKFSFVYNKLLKNFILLINPTKIFSGKYKCQFVVNDIIIFDKRYPTVQYNNEFYNVIDLIQKNKNLKNKTNHKPRNKSLTKNNNDNKNKKLIKDSKKQNINRKKGKIDPKRKGIDRKNDKNLSNSSNIKLENLKLALEDIIEEEDEGKSVTSKDNKYDKRLNEIGDKSIKIYRSEEKDKDKKKEKEKEKEIISKKENDNDNQNEIQNENENGKEKEVKNENEKEDDDDDSDFTYEDYLNIKKIKNKDFGNSNFELLKDELNEKEAINKIESVRRVSLKAINNNN